MFLYFVILKNSRCMKRFFLSLFFLVVSFVGLNLSVALINQIRYDVFTTASNPEAVLCNLLYTADDETKAYFKPNETVERKWFEEIYTMQEETETLISYVSEGAGLIERQMHYALAYDVIGYDIVHPVIYKTADQENIMKPEERILFLRDAEARLSAVLRRQNPTNYLQVVMVNFVTALAYTNARLTPFLLPFSLLIYAVYLALFFLLLRKRKIGCEAGKNTDRESRIIKFCVLTLIAILVNAALVSLTIFPQGRYMIYCMGMFYTSLMLMICVLFVDKGHVCLNHTFDEQF